MLFRSTLISVFAASTCSHYFLDPRRRHFFRRLDQGCIYLLIAGTMTPYGLVYFATDGWWLLLGPIWGLALAGFCSKVFWAHRVETVSTVSYVLLGWVPIVGIKRIYELMPAGGLVVISVGATCYTLGTLFLTLDQKYRWFHAVWHLLVIGGCACGYIGILAYVVPGDL